MLSNVSIAVTFIVCVTLLAIAAIAGIVILALNGLDVAVMIAAIGAPLIGILVSIATRVKVMHDAVASSTTDK